MLDIRLRPSFMEKGLHEIIIEDGFEVLGCEVADLSALKKALIEAEAMCVKIHEYIREQSCLS